MLCFLQLEAEDEDEKKVQHNIDIEPGRHWLVVGFLIWRHLRRGGRVGGCGADGQHTTHT